MLPSSTSSPLCSLPVPRRHFEHGGRHSYDILTYHTRTLCARPVATATQQDQEQVIGVRQYLSSGDRCPGWRHRLATFSLCAFPTWPLVWLYLNASLTEEIHSSSPANTTSQVLASFLIRRVRFDAALAGGRCRPTSTGDPSKHSSACCGPSFVFSQLFSPFYRPIPLLPTTSLSSSPDHSVTLQRTSPLSPNLSANCIRIWPCHHDTLPGLQPTREVHAVIAVPANHTLAVLMPLLLLSGRLTNFLQLP